MTDLVVPQWEACKVCGGDHWTKDHPDRPLTWWRGACGHEWDSAVHGQTCPTCASPEPQGLDAERLRKAMDVVVPESIPPLYWTNERLAVAIAAEYARLSRDEETRCQFLFGTDGAKCQAVAGHPIHHGVPDGPLDPAHEFAP